MTLESNGSGPTSERAGTAKHSSAMDAPCILDLVEDQNGTHWVNYGTASRSTWFSLEELLVNEKAVLAKLSGPGSTLLMTKSKNRFKKLIEDASDYRPANVAEHPGWCGKSFVFGDGTIASPKNHDEKIIVAFEMNPKFALAGTLEAWLTGVGRVVANQPLPLVMLAYAFVPALLRFIPAGIFNPQIELVGEPETGKSTLAVLAASVWAGDPDSDTGGGETWNRTLGSLDPLKVSHSDMLLMLDEVNMAGGNAREQADLIRSATFRFASTGTRGRLAGPVMSSDVRMALLSTSNEALSQLVKASKTVVGAVSSRMVTINVSKASGFLDTVPDHYEDASEAAAELRKDCARNYAHPGRIFAARLVEAAAEDEDKLRRQIAKGMAAFLEQLRHRRGTDGTSERVKTVFTMIFAAGTLARRWGLLPEEWGGLTKSLLNVFDRMEGRSVTTGDTASSALERVKKYAREHGAAIVRVKTMSGPVSFKKFSGSPGYLLRRDGKMAVLIPSDRFQLEFVDHKAMMQELRRLGLAKTEGGKKPKLTVKTPSAICAEGRVYWILLGTD